MDSSSLRALALDGLEVTAAVVAAVAASVAAFRSAEVTVADLELPAKKSCFKCTVGFY